MYRAYPYSSAMVHGPSIDRAWTIHWPSKDRTTVNKHTFSIKGIIQDKFKHKAIHNKPTNQSINWSHMICNSVEEKRCAPFFLFFYSMSSFLVGPWWSVSLFYTISGWLFIGFPSTKSTRKPHRWVPDRKLNRKGIEAQCMKNQSCSYLITTVLHPVIPFPLHSFVFSHISKSLQLFDLYFWIEIYTEIHQESMRSSSVTFHGPLDRLFTSCFFVFYGTLHFL